MLAIIHWSPLQWSFSEVAEGSYRYFVHLIENTSVLSLSLNMWGNNRCQM